MRFMFGQALAGAARRGSQRLSDLEQRANVITDRYVTRYINKYDEWNSKFKTDETAYKEAAQKLKQQGLDKRQIEGVLMGGIEGADNFISALQNDMNLHRLQFERQQNIGSTVKTPTGFSIGARRQEYGGYTDDARDKFLQGMFIKVGDYDPTKADQYGKDLAIQAQLYAQRKNPFSLDRDTDLAFKAEQANTLSAIGVSVPEEYLKSSFNKQLSAAGIKEREKILGELGQNTGYQPVNLNYVPADTIISLQNHAMGQQINQAQLQKFNQELEQNQDMHPLYKDKLIKEIGMLPLEEQNIRQRNIALETNNLLATYELQDYESYGRDNKKKISNLQVKQAEKDLNQKDVDDMLIDLNAQIMALKKKPKNIKNSQALNQLNEQMREVLTFDMTVRRNRAIANNQVTGIESTGFIEDRIMSMRTELRRQNGFVEGVVDRDPASPTFGKTLSSYYILEDGMAYGEDSLEYQQIENQIIDDSNYNIFKHAIDLNTGELKDEFKNDIGMKLITGTMNFDIGNGRRGKDIKAYLDQRLNYIQEFTKQEKIAVMMAIQAEEPAEEVIKAIALDNQIDEETATKYYNELETQHGLTKDKKIEEGKENNVPINKNTLAINDPEKTQFMNDVNYYVQEGKFVKAFQGIRTAMATGKGDALGTSPLSRFFGYFLDKGTEVSDRAKVVEAFRWWNSTEAEEYMYNKFITDKNAMLTAANDPIAYYYNNIKEEK